MAKSKTNVTTKQVTAAKLSQRKASAAAGKNMAAQQRARNNSRGR